MDVNELIDNLRMPSWHDLEDPDATLLADAADALSTLQAENEKLKNAADSWKKKWAGLDKAVRNGSVYRPMQEELNLTHEENQSLKDENEKLRAELDSVKCERDAAIEDIWVPKWISCKNGENCSFVSAITGMPDCAGCDNWEWRGQEKN